MRNLRPRETLAKEQASHTYLLNQVTTANDEGWNRVILFLVVLGVFTLFKIPRNNEFKLPSAFFPGIVDAGNPTTRSIRRGRGRVRMRNALKANQWSTVHEGIRLT